MSAKRPVPIVYTLPNLLTAGSGRALFEIASRLDRDRFAPHLLLARRGGALERRFEGAGIPVLEGQMTVPGAPRLTLPYRAFAAARRLVVQSSAIQSSAIQSSAIQSSAVPRGAIWHSFHYLDDYSESLIARFAGARAWLYTKKNMSWNARSWQLRTLGATRVLAQNRDMERDFFGRLWRRRTRLVPRGVDTLRFSPKGSDREHAPPREDAAQSRGDGLTVGCVAHLVPVKGHPTLLDAVARRPRLRLLIAGRELDEDYARALDGQIERLGLGDRVERLGAVDDVPSFLRRLDLFVLPTWARWRMEGSPVALLEAMSSGLPVIATDIPGSRDLVEDGESGLLVPPEHASALASALARLEDAGERTRLGEAARRRVLERFSIEREVADHEAIYAEVAGL